MGIGAPVSTLNICKLLVPSRTSQLLIANVSPPKQAEAIALLQHSNVASCCHQNPPSPSGAGALDEKNVLYKQQFWEQGNTTISGVWNPNWIGLPSTDPSDLYNTP